MGGKSRVQNPEEQVGRGEAGGTREIGVVFLKGITIKQNSSF